jgi:diacylglycerol kinase (ATP)
MKKFLAGFVFAWNGLKAALSEEGNLRFHVVSALLVLVAGFYFDVTAGEWLALTLTIVLVIVAELLNTAIEDLVNLVSPEKNPLAGRIKDIAAAAVLISALGAIITAIIIFTKYIIN